MIEKKKNNHNPQTLPIFVHDDINVHESVRLRDKQKGKKRPSKEVTSGLDFYRDTKEWRHIDRVIDWESNSYKETIMCPDGKIIRHCDEPLSEHRERGSAKRKKPI